MDSWFHDLRYALRTLRKSPGFAGAAIITLMLGIGVTTTIFSLVNTLLLRPMPAIEHIDRLVAVNTSEDGGTPGVSSYADYVDFRDDAGVFAALAAFKPRAMDLGTGGTSERVSGLLISANYFDALGVRPAAGRTFLPSEDREPDAVPVAILGYDLWQRRFGRREGVVGETIRLNGREFTIVGVAPAKFRGTMLDTLPEVFVPMMMQPHFMPSSGNLLDRRGWGGIRIVGRLADGTSMEQARANLEVVGSRLVQEYPNTNAQRRYSITSFREATLSPVFRSTAVRLSALLMVSVTLVLLIACVNVANLVLARSTQRVREVAVRQALGAGRGRVVRQLLIESIVLGLIGGAGGLMLALWSSEALRVFPLPAMDFSLDVRVLAFALLLSLLTGIAFGLAPALRGTALDIAAALKTGRSSSGIGRAEKRGRMRNVFVVAQVALSVLLLVGATLFIRTLTNLTSSDLGMKVENVLVTTLDPALQRYDGTRATAFYDEVLAEIEAVPGVAGASITSSRPGGMQGDRLGFHVEGRQHSEGRPDGRFDFSIVGVDYFTTVGIALREGRAFTHEDGPTSPVVMIVNETGARLLESLGGRPALGAKVSVEGPDGPWIDVVGIVADSKTGALRAGPNPFAYASGRQLISRGFNWPMSVVVRTQVEPLSLLPAVREAIFSVDPYLPIFDTTTLESYLFGKALFTERIAATVLALTAILAIVLAAVGLFGVLSYTVNSRSSEIGIRRALGAGTGDLLGMVFRQGMRLVAIGLVVGVAGSLVAGRAIAGFLYQVSGTDPASMAIVAAILTIVALVACWIPARRATQIDPMDAIRTD